MTAFLKLINLDSIFHQDSFSQEINKEKQSFAIGLFPKIIFHQDPFSQENNKEKTVIQVIGFFPRKA